MHRLLTLLLIAPLLASARPEGSGDWPGYRPKPPAVVASVPSPTPVRTAPGVAVSSTETGRAVNWSAIAACESGGRWNINSGNGYYGGLQMNMDFWRGYGGLAFAARPDLASEAEQIVVAERAYRSRGLSPWPVCQRYG